jgi:tetratricopeptide (TPR) repeat protein
MKKNGNLHIDRAGEKKGFNERLEDFLRANRTVLIVIGAVIVVAIAGLAIGSAVNSAAANASTQAIEKLSSDLSAWSSEQDPNKKAAAEKNLVAGLDGVVAKWPRQFAAARALSMKARIAEQNKDWASAERDWNKICTGFAKSYMAPLALQNAAVAAEERGAPDKAIGYYKALVKSYGDKTVGIPHAYFSLGRLAEASKDYAGASENYGKLVSSYPDDDWTKLAKDRIIFLKSQGLAK